MKTHEECGVPYGHDSSPASVIRRPRSVRKELLRAPKLSAMVMGTDLQIFWQCPCIKKDCRRGLLAILLVWPSMADSCAPQAMIAYAARLTFYSAIQ